MSSDSEENEYCEKELDFFSVVWNEQVLKWSAYYFMDVTIFISNKWFVGFLL